MFLDFHIEHINLSSRCTYIYIYHISILGEFARLSIEEDDANAMHLRGLLLLVFGSTVVLASGARFSFIFP